MLNSPIRLKSKWPHILDRLETCWIYGGDMYVSPNTLEVSEEAYLGAVTQSYSMLSNQISQAVG